MVPAVTPFRTALPYAKSARPIKKVEASASQM